jgi:hypothetical protein
VAYLGRYGKQDMTKMVDQPTLQLIQWARMIDRMIEEERKQIADPSNR